MSTAGCSPTTAIADPSADRGQEDHAMPTLTSRCMRDRFLHPAMDARALNLDQERLFFNPTPEVDSLLEHLTAAGMNPAARAACLDVIRRLVAANRAEGEAERQLAGAADRLAVELRTAESEGLGAPSAKRLAALLREPLGVIAKPPAEDGLRFVAAVRQVDTAIRETPESVLLSSTVEHELGPGRFALLRRLHASRRKAVTA